VRALKGRILRRVTSAAVAAVSVLVFAASAFAWVGDGGTVGCSSSVLGYVRFYYNDIADAQPPGSSIVYLYRDNDNSWHLRERNGNNGGGYWEVLAEPYLNFSQTWAGCRSYG
jgi:hypothetical protein